MKRKHLVLLLIVLLAIVVLSGCAPQPVDLTDPTVEPGGIWQRFVVFPLANALIWIEESLSGLGIGYSWGWAIILFTVIIKVITLPLTITQIRGMQAQRDIQPKIQALQKKYGKDREKISQEQMKLYKEAGVNPLSGCLPLLVQMPILFGLYHSIIVNSQLLNGQGFYWIPSINPVNATNPEVIVSSGLAFPEYTGGVGWIPQYFQEGYIPFLVAYLALPLLLVVTQFAMQKWMTPATPDTGGGGGMAAGMTKQMGLMMTFMFGFFTLQVPAALTLYWVTSNLLQMGQQWFITNRMSKSSSSDTTSDADKGSSGDVVIDSTAVVSDEVVPVTEPSSNGGGPTTTSKSKKKPKRRRSKRR